MKLPACILAMTIAATALPACAHPDLTGRYWSNVGYGTPPTEGDASPDRPVTDGRPSLEELALKEPYAGVFARWLEAERQGRPEGDVSALCKPSFLLGPIVNNVYPLELIQTDDQVLMLFEAVDRVRRIHIGATPPADLKPSPFGFSTGRWEGDVLVVETSGFTDETTLVGAPHSSRIRTTERLSLVPGTRNIQNDITIEDPEALSRPYHMRFVYRFEPSIRMMEYSCEENNRDKVHQNVGAGR